MMSLGPNESVMFGGAFSGALLLGPDTVLVSEQTRQTASHPGTWARQSGCKAFKGAGF